MVRSFLFATGIALTVIVAGCSSSDGSTSSGSGGCQEFKSTADLTKPTVSWKNDVMPIVTRACAFSSCHGGGAGNLRLTQDAAASRTALVDVNATVSPTTKRVAAGNPSGSFMLKKIDGDICFVADNCTNKNCGQTMPMGSTLLDVGERDTFRRWIAQGATDN